MAVGPETSYQHLLIDQGWQDYSAEEHETWQMLYERQMEVLAPQVCSEYLQALEALGFTAQKIPNFHEVNGRLREITGWEIALLVSGGILTLLLLCFIFFILVRASREQ